MITISKEDYLKAVSEAEAEGQTVIAATLAHWLSVTRSAVTTALKRLKKDGLVIVKSDGHIQLTYVGRQVAERTIFRHHLIATTSASFAQCGFHNSQKWMTVNVLKGEVNQVCVWVNTNGV